jgi:hypothetical protein
MGHFGKVRSKVRHRSRSRHGYFLVQNPNALPRLVIAMVWPSYRIGELAESPLEFAGADLSHVQGDVRPAGVRGAAGARHPTGVWPEQAVLRPPTDFGLRFSDLSLPSSSPVRNLPYFVQRPY